jgi:phosphoadenosine phosphosulfate reductase
LEFETFPQYKEMYIRAFDKMVEVRKAKGLENRVNWVNGQAVFDWWI